MRGVSNNSFKPTPHRGVNSVLCATLHAVATPPRGGLTQALGAMEITLAYFDQNDVFGALLPRNGVVVASPTCSDSTHSWQLLRLNEPLRYESVVHWYLLIASRLSGQDIGGPMPVSVFILLVPPSQAIVQDGFSHKDFEHVAWGMATALAPNNSFNPMPLRGTG